MRRFSGFHVESGAAMPRKPRHTPYEYEIRKTGVRPFPWMWNLYRGHFRVDHGWNMTERRARKAAQRAAIAHKNAYRVSL